MSLAILVHVQQDSLEGKMAADPLKNKKMLNKSTYGFISCSELYNSGHDL
jgi:hypothetical protein